MAERVRLSRAKGFRLPPGAIVVARPSKWGNPFRLQGTSLVVGPHGDQHQCANGEARGVAVRLYSLALYSAHLDYYLEDVRRELRGHDLACWCPLDQPCHADVLLQVANR
jgi:hypothetical protein